MFLHARHYIEWHIYYIMILNIYLESEKHDTILAFLKPLFCFLYASILLNYLPMYLYTLPISECESLWIFCMHTFTQTLPSYIIQYIIQ